LVASAEGVKELSDVHGQIKQGALENSNVSSISEMVLMMETLRHFESVSRVTQGYNDMIGTAIHKLGELS
jgi:flagellar basal-body rod protein FlgF